MQVTMSINYDGYVVDVSGAELETFTRVLSKLIPVYSVHDNDLSVKPAGERLNLDIMVKPNARLLRVGDKGHQDTVVEGQSTNTTE